jgi:PTS system fructose-specific IIC component
MAQMITEQLVRLDANLGADKHDVIRALADVVDQAGRATDAQQLADDALAREATAATGLNGGIAIPHCRSAGVDTPTLAFARLSPKVEFGAKDGPADLAFLIAAPAGGDASHLKLLAKLARALVKKEFTDSLRAAVTRAEIVELVSNVVGDEVPATVPAAVTPPSQRSTGGRRSLVAVTACPTGIAHTYMAAESLQGAAERAGVDILVETQGSAGAKPLPHDAIATADAVIFACDVGVRDRQRFAGKPVVSSGVKRAIDDGDQMIADALRYADDPNAPRVEGEAGDGGAQGAAGGDSFGHHARRVLMTGVSYMIPFVAAGGLLIALSFLLGGYNITDAAGDILVDNNIFNLPDLSALGLDKALLDNSFFAYIGAMFFALGATAFKFLVPALAGYIAYAIADRPGIAPGFVMGALAIDLGGFGLPQSGFLGGIIGGVMAGFVALWISRWNVAAWARGLMPVLVIPLLATMISGVVMIAVLSKPLGRLMDWLNEGLTNMSENSGLAILLGVLLGLMMAFDMGGAINKVAYSFAVAGLGTAATASDSDPALQIMAAVMLAGMVPPLALALATVLRPKLFTVAEHENGKSGWALGLSFITEGAIPFAAADPLRVIPAIMAGSAVTGGLSMALDVGVRAPHGGIFVLFAVINVAGYFIALIAGTVVGAVAVIALKSTNKENVDTLVTV